MDNTSLNISPGKSRFRAMIGTGGIGAGSLFLMSGNHTLGREESRGGKYLDARDYCKLHIITHNVKALSGADFPVFPLGKVGDDDVGRRIFREMHEAGLNLDYVHTVAGDKTLFGFCFLYPDGTGGNLTTEESACTKVDPSFIELATPLFSKYEGGFLALSAPEVPLAARKKLLELTRIYKGFSVASFTSGEMEESERTGMLSLVDFLAINIDEAAALTGMRVDKSDAGVIVERTIEKMRAINPSAWLSVTAGKLGSWSWDGKQLTHVPVFAVDVKSSAGAGDAHIAAIISGLVAGLTLQQSQVLGSLAGAFAVTSQHTIHPGMSRKNLCALAMRSGNELDPAVLKFLEGS
ncbi:MAG: carbohydrate kinase family protein [Cyclobacteriaceae bacterium]